MTASAHKMKPSRLDSESSVSDVSTSAQQVKVLRPIDHERLRFFDATAEGGKIYEEVQYRHYVTLSLMEAISASSFKAEDERLMSSVTSVAVLLLRDISAMLDEMGDRLYMQDGLDVGRKKKEGDIVIHFPVEAGDDQAQRI